MDAAKNPWVTTSRAVRFDNPWMQVREDQVLRPDGSAGAYGHVHFKNVAVGVLPLIDTPGGVAAILVGQWRYTLGTYSWEIPAGGCVVDGPESTLDAARRELAEETGMEAGDLAFLGHGHLSNSITDEVSAMYVARGLRPVAVRPAHDPSEDLRVARVPWDDVLARIRSGAITDALTLTTVLRYQLVAAGLGPIRG
ncbi:MAG: NUDIX hydrolase [Acidobacteriota bacterium]